MTKYRLIKRTHDYSALAIRWLLNVLLVIIIFNLGVAIYKAALDSVHAFGEPLETILENLLLDIVFIVAVVEIATVVMGYLKDGRVHIRYIIDTVLAIIANEFVVVWLHKPTLQKIIGLCLSLVTLTFVRVLIARYVPED